MKHRQTDEKQTNYRTVYKIPKKCKMKIEKQTKMT